MGGTRQRREALTASLIQSLFWTDTVSVVPPLRGGPRQALEGSNREAKSAQPGFLAELPRAKQLRWWWRRGMREMRGRGRISLCHGQ